MNGTDNALMGQVSNGEVAKMAVLFERHHRPLFRYFVSMNRNRELSEDLVQDVFFRMLRYRVSYDPKQSFTAWNTQTMRFTASATTQVLTFLSQGGPDGLPPFVFLDGVNLVETTPEPSTLVYAAVGLAGLIAAWRLRNKHT